MNNDCIRGYIFNSKVPLSCPRFSDFMGDGLCLLDSGVYIEFWHDRAVNHGSWWSRRPSAYNEEAILIEANENSGGLIHSLDSLVRFKPYRERLLRAAGKYYWGNSFVLSDGLSSKDYSSMIRRAGSKKALDDIEKVIKADKHLSSSEKKVLIENIEIERKFVKDMKFHDSEYTVAYVRNGVNQIIGVRANSEEEAKQKFLAYAQRKGGGYEFVGVSYGFESKPGFPVIDGAMMDAPSGYINLSYKVGSDYAGALVRANSLSEAIAKLHEKYPSAKVLGNYAATSEEAKHLISMGTPVLDGDSEVVGSADPKQDAAYDYSGYEIDGETYRGFEITSSDNGLRKGFYRFYSGSTPDTVFFGNSAVDGSFRKGDFMRLVEAGKIKLLDSERVISVGKRFKNSSDSVLEITGVNGDMVSFSVYGGSKGSPKMSRTLDSDAFDTLIKISGYRLVDADPDLDETHAFDDTVYAPIVDAYNKFEKETDKEYLQESIREMRRYISNWSFLSASQKRNISPVGGLPALKQDLKFAEDRLQQLSVKDSMTVGSTVRVPLKNGGTEEAKVVSVAGDIVTVRLKGGMEIDVAKSILKDSKLYKVVDKSSGKTLLVKATDSVSALCKVRDAVNFKLLADLINKALDAAEGKAISAAGAYATAGGNSVSVDVASSADVPAIKAIVESVISANADARASLKIRTSSHEVMVDRSAFHKMGDATPHEVVVYTREALSEMGLDGSMGKYDAVVRRMRDLYGESFYSGKELKEFIKKKLPDVLKYLGFSV